MRGLGVCLVTVALGAAWGCMDQGLFVCHDSAQCAPEGRCEATGYCSFPDRQCGWRYGRYAPPSLEGQCVDSPDGEPADAPEDGPPLVDAAVSCAATCPGTCEGTLCVIECSSMSDCGDLVTCPAGLDCQIGCGDDQCPNVDCSLAKSCVIDCRGQSSCENILCTGEACAITCSGTLGCTQVLCGPGRCDITCNDVTACGFINCQSSCACTVSCAVCGPICPDGCSTLNECSPLPLNCDAC